MTHENDSYLCHIAHKRESFSWVKIIHAEGEYQAAENLVSAASAIATEPVAFQLRYLQTLTEIGMEQNTTVVFPVPLQMIEGLSGLLNKQKVELPVSHPAVPATVSRNETHSFHR